MKPKVLAVLLLATNMTFTSISQAQIWGTGMYGGMQQCPYNNGAAPGAVDGDDEIHELENTRRDLKRDKRDAEKQLRDLESRKDKYSDTIGEAFAGGYGDSIKEHMENGYNCNCEPAPAVYEPPVVSGNPPPYEPASQPQLPPMIDEPTPEQPAPPPQPAPRPPHQSTDIFSPNKTDRAPASEGRGPASEGRAPAQASETMSAPPAQTSVRGNPLDADLGPGELGGPGGSSMCGPRTQLSTSRRWQMYCHDGGGVSKGICHDLRIATVDTRKRSTDCERAISEYRKVTKQADSLRNKIARIEDQISQIGVQIGDLKRDRKDDRELEASCPTGTCNRPRRQASSDNSGFNWSSLLPLAAGVVGGLGAEYLGYKSNQANNTNLNKLGWPTQPYQAGSYGLPFVSAGIYGSIAAGTQGSFGCGQGMNGGGPYNPFASQMGQMGNNNPFGYPNMFGFNPQMGGGMYAPGMGPWGQSGPWGNGYNPYMGMAGGLAGMPGMAGGIGLAGMPGMAGGMYGGLAGGGLAGGIGLAGMGAMGAFPGMAGGIAGMPGMAGGMYGGIAGGVGLAGMPGMAGGLYGGLYGGMAGGMATGFASPYGVAGGFAAAGGFLTPVASPFGLAGGAYQQQMQMQQMQIGMQMQAAQQQQAQVRAQQGLMSEYYSLMYRMQQVNLGVGLSGTLGGSSSGLVGGFGLGVGSGINYGLSGSLGGSTYYSPTLPISTTVPGRTR